MCSLRTPLSVRFALAGQALPLDQNLYTNSQEVPSFHANFAVATDQHILYTHTATLLTSTSKYPIVSGINTSNVMLIERLKNIIDKHYDEGRHDRIFLR